MRLAINELMYCAKAAGFEGDDIAIAGAVAMAESGGETEAIGQVVRTDPATGKSFVDNQDLGLWQISTKWHGAKLAEVGRSWRGPFTNARLAKAVWDEFKAAGKDPWSAWAVYNSKAYEKFLVLARDQLLDDALWSPPTPAWHW